MSFVQRRIWAITLWADSEHITYFSFSMLVVIQVISKSRRFVLQSMNRKVVCRHHVFILYPLDCFSSETCRQSRLYIPPSLLKVHHSILVIDKIVVHPKSLHQITAILLKHKYQWFTHPENFPIKGTFFISQHPSSEHKWPLPQYVPHFAETKFDLDNFIGATERSVNGCTDWSPLHVLNFVH